MGYAFMLDGCFVCGNNFAFNPIRVPSYRNSEGVRQAICRPCIKVMNVRRAELGMDTFVIHADAYECCDESELLL